MYIKYIVLDIVKKTDVWNVLMLVMVINDYR